MVRLDFEKVTPLAVTGEKAHDLAVYNCVAAGLDGIILSDYQKGVLTDSLAKNVIKSQSGRNPHPDRQEQRLDEI